MVTALTVHGTQTAATTITTADTMATTTGGAATTKNTLVGTSTGYGEIYSQGNASAWPAAGSIGSPSGHGWLFDVTTLEGNQIVLGNWTPTLNFAVGSGASTLTADIYCRAYKYNNNAYTLIGSMLLAAQNITATATDFVFSSTSLPTTNFYTGDKLYIDVWLNITVSTNNSAGTNAKITDASTATGSAHMQIVTPGYQVTPVAKNQASGHRSIGRVQ